MSIPDSDALLHAGLSHQKAYLGSPSVVDSVLRGVMHAVNEARIAQLRGADVDLMSTFRDLAEGAQKVFYGQDDTYTPSAWNQEKFLGAALVWQCGIGGDTSDAVARVMVRFIREFARDLAAHEAGAMSEQDMQRAVDALLKTYTQIFVGRPNA